MRRVGRGQLLTLRSAGGGLLLDAPQREVVPGNIARSAGDQGVYPDERRGLRRAEKERHSLPFTDAKVLMLIAEQVRHAGMVGATRIHDEVNGPVGRLAQSHPRRELI